MTDDRYTIYQTNKSYSRLYGQPKEVNAQKRIKNK